MAIEFKCSLCGHEWKSKLGRLWKSKAPRKPKSCPRCKRYDWDKNNGDGK